MSATTEAIGCRQGKVYAADALAVAVGAAKPDAIDAAEVGAADTAREAAVTLSLLWSRANALALFLCLGFRFCLHVDCEALATAKNAKSATRFSVLEGSQWPQHRHHH